MNLRGELLRTLGFSVRVRRTGVVLRLRNLVALAIVMGSVGTAVGYAVATRGVDLPDDDIDGHAG